MKLIEGQLSAKDMKFGIIVSRFNNFISSKLLDGAMDAIARHGGSKEDVTVVWVPGAFEIPGALRRMADSGKFDAVLCLGAVIRGATPHFEYVAAEVTKGIALIGMEGKVPIGYGVLTTDTIEQAIERAGSKAGNKGAEAAMAVLEMISVYEQLR
jgi:6,7-dimethyl-8-ribityllumazine synthase